MGIVRLSQFLAKKFPHLFKKRPHSSFTNQIYAVDASNKYTKSYQAFSKNSSVVNAPTDSSGNQTGHLIGLMNRVLFCREINMKTVWVFDGRPPQQKSDELFRRKIIK